MSHSHVPVQHLLKQLEARRANRRSRDLRPEWLREFIDDAAQLFEPDRDVARVGFRCKPGEDGWIVELFVGQTEVVGGPDDGRNLHTPYHLDVTALLRLFATGSTTLRWQVSTPENATPAARLEISGRVGADALQLRILSAPPGELGPGLQQLPDGSVKPV